MYYLGIQWTQRTYSGHSGHTVDTSQQFSISVLTKNLSTYKISGSLTELVNIQYCDAREGECSLVGNCLFVCLFGLSGYLTIITIPHTGRFSENCYLT